MTMTRYLFTTGPEGADATTANTGASVVNKGTNATIKFAAAMAGTSGTYGLASSAANANALVRLLSDTSNATMAFSGEYVMPDVVPTAADYSVHTVRYSAGVVGRILWRTTGTFVFADSNNAYSVILTAGTITAGQKIRIEEQYVGNSTTAGSVKIQVYKQSDDSLLGSVTVGTANLTANAIVGGDFGNTGGVSQQITAGIANIQIDSGRTTPIGKYVASANTPPTVSAGVNKTTTPGVATSLTGTASDSDGTIVSYVWTFDSIPPGSTAPTLTNATTATVSFTPTVVGVYTLRFTATDNGGATGFGTATVSVAGTNVTVIGVTSNTGGWVPTPNASTLTTVLSDSDTTTYAESPTSPSSAAALRMRLAPIQTPATFSLVLGTPTLNGTGTLATSVRLYEGATLRKEWTNVTVNGSDLVLTLTTAEIATVTSWNALDVELSTVAV